MFLLLRTGAICVKMQEKLIHKYPKWDHATSIQNQPSTDIWKIILKT